MRDLSVSAVAAFSGNGRVFRAFNHLIAAGDGALLCVPLAVAAGDLRHVTDGCPVPWEEACAVLDAPMHFSLPIEDRDLMRKFPLLAQLAPQPWRGDWIGLGPSPARPVLRLTHDSGIRYAVVRGRP